MTTTVAPTIVREFLSPVEVAARLVRTTQAIYGLMNRGEIPFVLIGGRRYIRREALDHYLQMRKEALIGSERNY